MKLISGTGGGGSQKGPLGATRLRGSLGFSGYFILTLTFTLHHLGIFPGLVSHIARIQILSHVPSIFSLV